MAAKAEKEQRRAARRRAFFDKYGDKGNSNRSSDSNTYRVSKNSKGSSDSKWAVFKAGQIAAVSEEYLDEAFRYLADDDPKALQVLLDAGNVFLMQQGIRVYELDTKIGRGRVKIRVEGTKIELWTALASSISSKLYDYHFFAYCRISNINSNSIEPSFPYFVL